MIFDSALKPLMCRKMAYQVLDLTHDIEITHPDLLGFDPIGFDLGKIQYIVNDVQQVLTVSVNRP